MFACVLLLFPVFVVIITYGCDGVVISVGVRVVCVADVVCVSVHYGVCGVTVVYRITIDDGGVVVDGARVIIDIGVGGSVYC